MNNLNWNSSTIGWEWVIAGSISLLFVLIYIELKRRRKRRLSLRLLLIACMVVSLALIALKPAWKKQQNKMPAVLLIKGFIPRVLDSLQKEHQEALKIFTYEPVEYDLKDIPVAGLGQIAALFPEVEKLFVLGTPLPTFNQDVQYPFELVLLLNEPEDGILKIEFPDEVSVNEPIEIRGRFKHDGDEEIHLMLKSPEGALDSLKLPKGVSDFSLTTIPKAAGRFLYSLVEKNPAKTEERFSPIPVVVKPFEPLQIAIHGHTPSFEIRALKNWLGELGHQIAVQTQISRSVYHREFINQENVFDLALDKENLEKLDVLIMEGAALSKMGAAELSVLRSAISEGGMALLVLADGEIIRQKNSSSLRSIAGFKTGTIESEAYLLEKTIKGKNIQGEIERLPYRFEDEPNVNHQFEGLLASRNLGTGKTGMLLSSTTHTLNLKGQEDLFAHFWTTVLNNLLPDNAYAPGWTLSGPIHSKNAEVHFKLLNYPDSPKTIVSDDDSTTFTVAMRQDAYLPEHWTGKFWPSREGWYSVSLEDQNMTEDQAIEKWFYVQNGSTWRSLRTVRDLNKMQSYIDNHAVKTADTSPSYSYVIIDRIYFFAIFLLSCGLLWVEQKF